MRDRSRAHGRAHPPASRRPHRLRGVIQPYAWGSRHVLAELLGRPSPSPEPEAELWLGAHPRGPALLESGDQWRPFDAVLRDDPESWLGPESIAAHGPRLPFLLKVLAVEQPLSLQAHPDDARAAAVFDQERTLPDAERRYTDPHGKPELVCALTRFEALCGVRPLAGIRAWLDAAGLAALLLPGEEPGPASAIRASLAHWLRRPPQEQREPLARLRAHAARRASSDAISRRVCELAALWPEDPGLLAPVWLHAVTLAPGEALYFPPGVLHCYLSGAAIELMAASDNVVRAGLTPKPVHVDELLAVGHFEPAAPDILTAVSAASGNAGARAHTHYPTPSRAFQLSRLEPEPGTRIDVRIRGAEILLCTDGQIQVSAGADSLRLTRGDACAMPASAESYTVAGRGTAFRAGLPGGS